MPSPKEEEVKNWTCDEVIVHARPSSLPKPSLLPPRSRVQDRLGPLFRGRGQDPKPVPFKSQSKLDGFLSRQGAGCLRLTAGTDNPFVLDLEELADGDTYSMVANEYSGSAKVKKGLNIVKGGSGPRTHFWRMT